MLIVGGQDNRFEVLVVGNPMSQAARAEGAAASGEVVVSSKVWELLGGRFDGEEANPPGEGETSAEREEEDALFRITGLEKAQRSCAAPPAAAKRSSGNLSALQAKLVRKASKMKDAFSSESRAVAPAAAAEGDAAVVDRLPQQARLLTRARDFSLANLNPPPQVAMSESGVCG